MIEQDISVVEQAIEMVMEKTEGSYDELWAAWIRVKNVATAAQKLPVDSPSE